MQTKSFSIDLTPENFQQVLESSMQQPVLLDFWADWCAPCKVILPILEKLAQEFAGAFILAKINIEEQPELAAQFQVRSVPTVMLVSQGQLADQFQGALPESQIREFLAKHLTSPLDAVKEQIKQLLAENQLEAAQSLLVEAINLAPDEVSFKLDLARVLIQTQQTEAAAEVLNQLPDAEKATKEVKALLAGLNFAKEAPSAEDLAKLADDTSSQASYLKAMAALATGEHEQAIELLLSIIQTDKHFKEGLANTKLVEVFGLLGEASPLVIKARRRLYTLMY